MRADLTLVVSPLVSLMQDQVEALERVAPGPVGARSTPSRTPRPTAGRSTRRSAGHLRLLYVAPERFSSPGFVERAPRARDRAVRRRRGALRLAVGPRLPAGLLPPRRRGALARARRRSSPRPRPRRRRWRRTSSTRLGLRDPVPVATGFDRPEPLLRRRAVPDARRPCTAASPRRWREPGALPGDRLRRHARGVRPALAAPGARARASPVVAYHAGLPRDARAEAQRRFMAGEIAGRRGHQRVRHGRRQGRRAHGLPRVASRDRSRPTTRRPAARAATARRRGACCSPAARDKGLHVFFIERATVDDDEHRRGRRGASLGRASDGRYDVGVARARRASRRCEEDGVRAIVGHLARAGVAPAVAVAAGPACAAASTGAWDGAALATLPHLGARTATRARWRQYRAVWAWVEDAKCRRAGDPAALRRPRRARARGALLRRLRARPAARARQPAARRRGRGGAGRQLAQRPQQATGSRPRRRDPRAVGDRHARRSGARGRSRSCAAARSKVIVKYAYDGLPHYGTFGHLRADDGPRARRRAARRRHAALHRRALPEAGGCA